MSSIIFGDKGAKPEEIGAAEKALGVIFADDYRELLRKHSIFVAEGHEFAGICGDKRLDVVQVTERNRNQNIPSGMYCIEEAGVDGITVWQDSSGGVWQTAYSLPPVKIADSIEEFIEL